MDYNPVVVARNITLISDSMAEVALNDLLDKALNLMQYTGLKDRSGKEIYEGDILRMGYGDGSFHESLSVVKFGVHNAGYDSETATTGPALGFYFSPYPYEGDMMGIGENFNWGHSENYEVIGNIYEHPDLLK